MAWVKLDDKFHGNKKVGQMEPDLMLPAVGLHMLALSWCGDELTDGHVPKNQVRRLAGGPADEAVAELLRVGLWEPAEDGYQIHDYLDYNPSREEALANQKVRSAAGKKGAEARWNGKSHGTSHGGSHSTGHSTSHGTTYANANGKSMRSRCPDPEPDPVPELSITPQPLQVGNSGGGDLEDPLLEELREIEGWHPNDVADQKLLQEVRAKYPRADLAEVIGDVQTKAASNALKTDLRSAVRKFARHAHEKAPPERPKPPPVEPVPDLTEEQQAVNVEGVRIARQRLERLKRGGK